MKAAEIQQILTADLSDPFALLGMHRQGKGVVVRVFLPRAQAVVVVDRHQPQRRYEAVRLHDEGVFCAEIADRNQLFSYELEVRDENGRIQHQRDPYSFWPQLSPYDQYLFNEGTHFRSYEVLGAHTRQVDGTDGVFFAVWAPAARRVSVVGEFNQWDGRRHCMRPLGNGGIWELFIPHLGPGEIYKFEVRDPLGWIQLKADPYGFAAEMPPSSASVISELGDFSWGDSEWMAGRGQKNWSEEPMAVYEVHLGSWRKGAAGEILNYRQLAEQMVPYVRDLGFTHIELMPVAEHPFTGSWGYQIVGFFAPTSRYGNPEDFAYFVDYCHQHGIGVIVDWVPAHFPKDAHGLARFDGTHLYEHSDPRQGEHPDWGSLVFNYGRNEVRSFLISNALFWFDRYHIDGIRVDAVASMLYLDYSRKEGEWIPNASGGRENLEAISLLQQMNAEVYSRFPGALTIAEESTAWPLVSKPTYVGGLGFGFKWNMGWMNDVLAYIEKDPVHRKFHHHHLTFGLLYAYNENFILPFSHDEVVHGKKSLLAKMPGDAWQQLANLRLLYGFMYGHPGKKLLFMGGELGQWSEWDHDGQLDWPLLEHENHQGVQRWVCDLNQLYRTRPALSRSDSDAASFTWIECEDVETSVLSFWRRDLRGEELIFVCNFTPVPRLDYRLGIDVEGHFDEVLNSDASVYGGSGVGNGGGISSEAVPWADNPYSLRLQVPPLGVVILSRG